MSEGDRIEAERRPFRRPKASDRSQVWTKARSPGDSSRVPETSSWGSHSKRKGPSKRGRNRSSMPDPTFPGQNQFNVSKITTTLPKGIIFIEINDNDTTVLNLDAGSVRQKKRIEFGQSKRLSVTSKGHPGHRRVAMELSRGDGPQGSRLSHQQHGQASLLATF